MAMLAEPRQRKRYNLVPRGKALYEDDNRFGTKMLEKMGWSKGKGLGANEDGSKDFVRVRYKNDANGFGYEDRDDQWTQHEESFNGLLKSLHGEEGVNVDDGRNEENDADEVITTVGFGFQSEPKRKKQKLKEKFSGESLEEKSKNSKARVHYKKFTRGKDLSRYSEKDLANIFGKKETGEQGENAAFEHFKALEVNSEDVKQAKEDEKEVSPNFAGVPTINTGLSVSDYFKQKMEALKNKRKNETEKLIEVVEDGSSECSQEFKKKKKKEKCRSTEVTDEGIEVDYKKLKKKKKQKDEESLLNSSERAHQEKLNDVNEEEISQLKSKKKKQKRAPVEEAEENGVAEITSHKKKKRKLDNEEKSPLTSEQSEVLIADSKKRKKEEKRKAKELKENQDNNDKCEKKTDEISAETHQSNDIRSAEKANKEGKKKLKKPPADETRLDVNSEKALNESETERKKRKESKKKNEDSIESTHADISNSHQQETQSEPSGGDNSVKLEQHNNVNSSKTSKTISSTKKTKDVSLDCSSSALEEQITLEALKTQLNSYNIFTISSYCAEKFRNTDLSCFDGSSLSQIVGYSLSDQLQLNIKNIRTDEDRILQLWSGKSNKYENQKLYKKYIKEAHIFKNNKKKIPRLDIKVYKKQDAFTGI